MENSVLTDSEVAVLEHAVPGDVRERLTAAAHARFGPRLHPILGEIRLDDCFRCSAGRFIFWFNTPDHSTHIVYETITLPTTQEEQCRKS